MKLLKNKKGAVFDISEKSVKMFEGIAKGLESQNIIIKRAETLPEIEEVYE